MVVSAALESGAELTSRKAQCRATLWCCHTVLQICVTSHEVSQLREDRKNPEMI